MPKFLCHFKLTKPNDVTLTKSHDIISSRRGFLKDSFPRICYSVLLVLLSVLEVELEFRPRLRQISAENNGQITVN